MHSPVCVFMRMLACVDCRMCAHVSGCVCTCVSDGCSAHIRVSCLATRSGQEACFPSSPSAALSRAAYVPGVGEESWGSSDRAAGAGVTLVDAYGAWCS